MQVPEGTPTRLPPGSDRIEFRLQRVTIVGMTAYPAGTFEPLYADLIGTDVSLSRLYELRAEIERRYRQDGYILTRVVVPRQTIRDGEFTLQVVEGFIDRLDFEGDVGPSRALVEKYLGHVVGEVPLNVRTLERYLLLANDIPGLHVQGVLRPSRSNPGAAELVATMDRKPFAALLLWDNYGTEYTGVWEGAATASANAFTSWGEQNSVTGLLSDPLNGFTGSAGDNYNEWILQYRSSWRLGGSGTFLEVLSSYGRSKPGFLVKSQEFDSKTLLMTFDVGYPFTRSRDINFTGLVGFDFENADTDALNQRFSRDRLRYFSFTARGDARDAWQGNTRGEFTVQQGVDLFDATTEDQADKSREGTGVATVLNASLSRQQALLAGFEFLGMQSNLALYGSAAGQYAFDDLLSEQLFELGGLQYGRGYDLGEFSGTQGIGTTTELQLTQRPPALPIDNYQLFAFVDHGWVWFRQSGSDNESVTSAGGGVRVSLFGRLSLEFVGAKPISPDSERSSGKSPRFGKEPQFLFRAIGTW